MSQEIVVPMLPPGHRLIIGRGKAVELGHWLAEDAHGYEYVVGCGHYKRGDDSIMVSTDVYGTKRIWVTDKSGHTTESSPNAIAQKWEESIPPKLRSKPWLLPDGKPPRLDENAKRALDRLRGWGQTYIAGKHKLSIWLWGETGRGKTQASLWIGTELSKAGKKVERIEAAAIKERLRATYNSDQTIRRAWEEDLSRLKTVEVLVLDDVGAEAQDEDVRAVMFSLIDHRNNFELVTLATSNQSIADLAKSGIDQRLVSRLGSYQSIALTGPDHRTAKNVQEKLI